MARTDDVGRTDERVPEVERAVAAAREATDAVEDYDQAAVDSLVRAVGWAVLREDRCVRIVSRCARETGIGTQEATRRKLRRIVRTAIERMLGESSVGRIDTDRPGVVEVVKPVGVVGALVPSTNPAATTAFLAAAAVKGRNAVVFSPPPPAVATCELVVSLIRDELARAGAPRDLVQILDREPSREAATALLDRVDVAHVTGSAANVEAGETVGTPNYCVGAGNPVAVVDETADPAAAAGAVARGARFDHGAVCTSESCVVVDERAAADLLDGLRDRGGYVCSPAESRRVADALFEGDERTRSLLAAPAGALADAAGVAAAGDPAFLALRGAPSIDRPELAREKLAPAVTVYVRRGFDDLLAQADRLLDVDGAGHSCVLHTDREERVRRLAREVDVCRAVVNQPGALGLAGVGNGLDATLCLGAGVWGGNQLDENLTFRHFLTSTRVARPTDDDAADGADPFAPYRDATRGDRWTE